MAANPTITPAVSGLSNTAVAQPEPDDRERPVPVAQSLASYAAMSVYFSFLFHILTLCAVITGLWLLNRFYLEEFESVDPIRAALSDEIVLDDDPLTETLPMEISPLSSVEVKEDTAVSIAKSISEASLESARVLDMVAGSRAEDGSSGLSVWMPKGANAVTRGSFTAWTDPVNPDAGQAYSIIIEVKLPASYKIYRLSDLSGRVVGTDRYSQNLPWDRNTARVHKGCGWPYVMKNEREQRVSRSDRIRVRENKIQTRIKVPGADRKVRDLITIRSEKLKEEQELELLFGKPTDGD